MFFFIKLIKLVCVTQRHFALRGRSRHTLNGLVCHSYSCLLNYYKKHVYRTVMVGIIVESCEINTVTNSGWVFPISTTTNQRTIQHRISLSPSEYWTSHLVGNKSVYLALAWTQTENKLVSTASKNVTEKVKIFRSPVRAICTL